MFGKVHSEPVEIICFGWDDEKGYGNVLTELQIINAYIDPIQKDNITYHNKEEAIKEFYDRIKNIQIRQSKQPKRTNIFESEEIMVGTLYSYNDKSANIIKIPSCPVNVLVEDENVLLTIHGKSEIQMKEGKVFYLDITDDPTNQQAGATISLGYYAWRFEMKDFKLVSENPIQLICSKKNFNRRFSRPTRIPQQ